MLHLDFQNKKWILGLIGLVLLFRIFIQASVYQAGYISLTADEFSRTVVASRWSEHPNIFWSGSWLPLYSYFFGTALHFVWELLWAPRLLAIFTGVISIIFMYLLASSLFESPKVGLLSAFLLSINPAHVWLAGVPLSEAPNAMCVLAAIWAFGAYLKNLKLGYLFTAACALALANGFRFESWILSVLFSLTVLGECLFGLAKRKVQVRKALNQVIAAAIPWIFPSGWLIGNYIETHNPIYYMQAITNYKIQSYGQHVSYRNYLDTFLKIDPYLTFLGIIGIIVCLLLYKRSKAVRWYVAITTIPLAADILLMGGQIEPPGNYIRYFALFIFLFYPALAYLLFLSARAIQSRLLKFGVVLLLVLAALSQINTTFRFTNDPSADGLAVGLAIRELRAHNPEISERPVIIELSYWQYLAIKIGANDIDGVVYDRVKGTVSNQNRSLLLTDELLFQSCLKSYNVSYVIVKDPQLRDVIEKKLQIQSTEEINGYAFYPIRTNTLTNAPADWVNRDCPLDYTSGESVR